MILIYKKLRQFKKTDFIFIIKFELNCIYIQYLFNSINTLYYIIY